MPHSFSSSFAVVWRVSLFVLIFGLLCALFLVPTASFMSANRPLHPAQVQLYYDFSGALAMLAASWVMLRFVDHRPFLSIGLAREHAIRDSAVGLALGAAWLGLSLAAVWLLGWATAQWPTSYSLSRLGWAAASLVFNVLTQQLLLCGYVFQTLRARTNLGVATLISAGVFSLYHFAAFQGAWLPAVNVFLAGALFCIAFEYSGTLWLPMAIHGAWNFLLGPVLSLTLSGNDHLGIGQPVLALAGPELMTGGRFGLEGGLVVTVATLTLIALLSSPASRRVLLCRPSI